jgi:hypothetical protein
MGQGKGVVASFRLVYREHRELELPSGWSLRIMGVVASFWLEPENSRELYIPSGWSLCK